MKNNLKTGMSTASYICHELTNYLSVMKFQQEDIEDNIDPKYEEFLSPFFNTLDYLIITMDFFRNVYSPTHSKNDVLSIISKISKIKNIKLNGINEIIKISQDNPPLEKLYAGIIYIAMKSCRDKSSLSISIDNYNNPSDIRIIFDDINSFIKQSIIDALTNNNFDIIEEDSYNVFALYMRRLSIELNMSIKINNNNDKLVINICKQ